MVDPVVAVKTLLLQTQLPDITLRPGTSVAARVLSRAADHGLLVTAGGEDRSSGRRRGPGVGLFR
jgi:hypothetical protein